MTQPKRVKPKPIVDAPHAGQLRVVIAFRIPGGGPPIDALKSGAAALIRRNYPVDGQVDVAIVVIGAGGERVIDEGRYDGPSLAEDIERVRTLHDSEDIDTGGKL
jgi:hypothetical protein